MANLLEQLQGQLSGDLISQLSNQLGGAGTEQTSLAANGILSTLVSQLARNASTPEGANNTLSAATELSKLASDLKTVVEKAKL